MKVQGMLRVAQQVDALIRTATYLVDSAMNLEVDQPNAAYGQATVTVVPTYPVDRMRELLIAMGVEVSARIPEA